MPALQLWCCCCCSGVGAALLFWCSSGEDLVLNDKNLGIEVLGIAWASQSYVEKSETRTDDWKSSDNLHLDVHKGEVT